jgi:membrane associated rhomboid family serine protease
MGITDEIKQSFKHANAMFKLIYINLAVFLIINIIYVFYFLFGIKSDEVGLIKWLAVPAFLPNLATKPWTLITYMFTHENFLHILFNMLTFYWFSVIFLSYFDEKKLLNLYILGGIVGAVFYILSFNIFPVFQASLPISIALGASASVLTIMIAISVYVPNNTIYLVLIGPVKLKYIALFFIFLDILSIPVDNSGGHIAHLGGAFFGWLFATQMKGGRDITKGFGHIMDGIFSLFKRRERVKISYRRPKDEIEYNSQKLEHQNEIDLILDKISKGGYESLTKEEKDILFRMGK